MTGKTILVIDDDAKNLEVLVSGLVSSGFQVLTSGTGYDGLIKAKKMHPDLILLDTEVPDLGGIEFMQKIRADADTESIPVIFLSTRDGVQDRVRAYLEGAKDYIVKPMHMSEIVARVRMILSRLERQMQRQAARNEGMKGRLEEKNLARLVEELGMQKASGILTLHSQSRKSGQVFFGRGKVLQAVTGSLKGVRAFYSMVPWSAGEFHFVAQEVNMPAGIGVSSLGLLLGAKKHLETREKLLSKLPGEEAVLVLTPIFLKIIENRQLQPDAVKFIELFDGHRTVQRVVEDSPYDDLTTLQRMVKMFEQGFLKELKPVETKPAREEPVPAAPEQPVFFREEEFETFQRRVLKESTSRRRALLILGTAESGKSDFVRVITGDTYRTRTFKNLFPHPVDMGKLRIGPGKELAVLGIPVEKTLRVFVETLEDTMLGYVILISAVEPHTLDYLAYLIKTFRNRYQLPYAIAITNLRHPQAMDIESLAQQLGLESYEELLSCNPQDPDNIKMILLNMYSPLASREYLKIRTPVSEYNN